MNVGLYARVSTHDQQTLNLQMTAMRAYVKSRGWSVVVQIKGVGSGASERIKREEMLKAARRRDVDVVLVWRLDRWGRSLPDLIVSLQELSELGASFISLTEALDMTTPSGVPWLDSSLSSQSSNVKSCANESKQASPMLAKRADYTVAPTRRNRRPPR